MHVPGVLLRVHQRLRLALLLELHGAPLLLRLLRVLLVLGVVRVLRSVKLLLLLLLRVGPLVSLLPAMMHLLSPRGVVALVLPVRRRHRHTRVRGPALAGHRRRRRRVRVRAAALAANHASHGCMHHVGGLAGGAADWVPPRVLERALGDHAVRIDCSHGVGWVHHVLTHGVLREGAHRRVLARVLAREGHVSMEGWLEELDVLDHGLRHGLLLHLLPAVLAEVHAAAAAPSASAMLHVAAVVAAAPAAPAHVRRPWKLLLLLLLLLLVHGVLQLLLVHAGVHASLGRGRHVAASMRRPRERLLHGLHGLHTRGLVRGRATWEAACVCTAGGIPVPRGWRGLRLGAHGCLVHASLRGWRWWLGEVGRPRGRRRQLLLLLLLFRGWRRHMLPPWPCRVPLEPRLALLRALLRDVVGVFGLEAFRRGR